jgi:glycogen(starch) synthase
MLGAQKRPNDVDRERGIYYLAVAGDVAQTWEQWQAGVADRGSASVTYSGQFFDACQALKYRCLVSYPSEIKRTVGDSAAVVSSRPPERHYSGIKFHMQRLKLSLTILRDLLKQRPRYAVLMDGVCYWFVLAPARWAGVRMILSVHTVFWPPFAKVSKVRRVMLALEGWFIARHCYAIMGVSRQIVEQAKELAGINIRSSVFLPYYDRASFDQITSAEAPGDSVRLLFIGRVEANKGVFDLLQVVSALKNILHGRVSLTIVGEGSAYQALLEEISRLGLEGDVSAPGAFARDRIIAELQQAQIVVVPTRSTFPEGYAKSAVESILAHRPLVTSAVCPALDDLREAVEEARPDDVQSYVDAIARLCHDPARYAARVRAAGIIRERYFDESLSWGAKFRALIEQ